MSAGISTGCFARRLELHSPSARLQEVRVESVVHCSGSFRLSIWYASSVGTSVGHLGHLPLWEHLPHFL